MESYCHCSESPHVVDEGKLYSCPCPTISDNSKFFWREDNPRSVLLVEA